METESKPVEPQASPGAVSLDGRLIHIISPHVLAGEALAKMISEKTGARCLCLKNFEEAAAKIQLLERRELFLWDCLGKNLDEFMAEFVTSLEKVSASQYLALFNVRQGQGIEGSCVSQGVRGIFYEDVSMDLFLKGLGAICREELWFSRECMSKFILDDRDEDNTSMKARKILTQREIEILSLLAVGCKNEEIADRLCVSPHTIKTHLYNIYKKISVNNRLQATLWAAKNL